MDAARRLREDLDERETGRGVERVVDVADAKEDGEEHGEAEGAVERDARHEAPGDDGGGVFDLFAHVDGTVGTCGWVSGVGLGERR